jgi:hypothetical protein
VEGYQARSNDGDSLQWPNRGFKEAHIRGRATQFTSMDDQKLLERETIKSLWLGSIEPYAKARGSSQYIGRVKDMMVELTSVR